MDNESHNFGMSVIDRLLIQSDCKYKIFTFDLYNGKGKLNFCIYPSEIKDKSQISWA